MSHLITNLAAKMQCSLGFVKFIATICEQTTNFFSLAKVLFGLIFFPKVMLEIGGAAYTQVFREVNNKITAKAENSVPKIFPAT